MTMEQCAIWCGDDAHCRIFYVRMYVCINNVTTYIGRSLLKVLRGLLCRWPSITELEVHIAAQPPPPSPK